jgi:hypothetical protein
MKKYTIMLSFTLVFFGEWSDYKTIVIPGFSIYANCADV